MKVVLEDKKLNGFGTSFSTTLPDIPKSKCTERGISFALKWGKNLCQTHRDEGRKST